MAKELNLKEALTNAVNLYRDNNLNESIEQIDEILKHRPDDKNSLRLLIDIYIKLSLTDKALEHIDVYLNYYPSDLDVLEKKAKVFKYLNDDKGFIKSIKTLHERVPSINTARLISNYYITIDQPEKADDVIKDFFENNKSYSELYKGIRHARAGRVKLAEQTYKKILSNDPDNVDALRLFGLLAFKTKNYNLAEKLYIRTLTLMPSFSLAWDNLAKLYRIQNKLSKAIPAFSNLIKLDPNNFEALVSLGTICTKLAKYEEGIQQYKKALLIDKTNARVYLSMGHALKTIGSREECERAYLNAIKYFPLSGEAYWSLANLKTYKFSALQIKEMNKLISSKIPSVELIQIHFALGKAFESNKEYSKSFVHYKEGNWLQRKEIDYNANSNSDLIEEYKIFFSSNKKFLDKYSGHEAEDPIFILGLPRSGSTLVEQILSAHSLIEGTQELPNIMATSKKIKLLNQDNGYPLNILDLDEAKLKELGRNYIDDTKWSRTSKPFFIDKMPNNFLHIGLIKLILPNAKIIDVRRNPMDACFSCFKQYFAKGQHFTYDLDDIARFYKDYINLMNFWNSIFPGDIYKINYEDMISSPEIEISNLLKYCNVNFEEDCMEFYKSKRPVKTASSEQVRQPIYKSGLDYWKNYSDNLNELQKHFPNYAK